MKAKQLRTSGTLPILILASMASAPAAVIFQDQFNYADEAAFDAAYTHEAGSTTQFNTT